MKYRNAGEILPRDLLSKLQQYAEGELVYIPRRMPEKAGWGTQNGSRERYTQRNTELAQCFRSGLTVEELSRRYFLSRDSVKKIIRAQQAAE